MKRLLLFTPLLLSLAACGTTGHATSRKPLSRSARLDDVPLRLDVAALHRTGGIATLDLRLTNRGPRGADAFAIDDTFSREGLADLRGVLMVDARTGSELDALDRDLDVDYTEIAGGGTQALRVVFPAPSGSAVDILVPHFGLFRDVPVH
jgi:hypothetical protein